MGDNKNKNQQGDFPVDDPISESESTIQYTHLIEENVFIGIYPFTVILEGIQKQFEDYINMEDTTNYVDVFFNQLRNSYNAIEFDDGEEHPVEKREVLDKIYGQFVSTINNLFNVRVAINMMHVEEENIFDPDLEFIIRRLYEFFILGAKDNFKVVITTDVIPILKGIGDDDNHFFRTLQGALDRYSPLLTTVTPMQFIKYRGDQEIYDLFESGRVTGNFLRKYTPKLYQNEDFQVDLVNYITMVHQFKQDVISK